MQTYLFIFGPLDGHRIGVEARFCELAYPNGDGLIFYDRIALSNGSSFFVLRGRTVDEATQVLLDNYNPKPNQLYAKF